MSPYALAGVWLAVGVLAAALLPGLHRRRLAWLAAVAVAVASGFTASVATWPGPGPGGVTGPALGRPGLGLLVAAGVALAVTWALAPVLDGREPLVAGAAGAGMVICLSATSPLVWGVGIATTCWVLATRWIVVAPGRGTLAAGRVAGLGAAALLVGAALVPVAGARVDTRTALAGGLLAGGVSALLALLPLGGWAAAAGRVVRGTDLAPWAFLLAPAVLFTSGVLLPGLPPGTSTPFANVLLDLGLISALWGGLQAAREPWAGRYPRILLADLALAAAGLGSTHSQGHLGGFVLVMTHLCAGPLLLHPPRPGTSGQRRLAWLTMTGIPPSPSFWGRFMVLAGLGATDSRALVAGLVVAALLLVGAARSLLEEGSGDLAPAGVVTRALAWMVALAAVAVGFAPWAVTSRVFGIAAGTG